MTININTSAAKIAVAGLCLCLASAGDAVAGFGSDDSPPVVCDARAPDISFITPSENEILHGLDLVDFIWSLVESHPASDESSRRASLVIDGIEHDFTGFDATEGQHVWTLIVPDLSSGSCQLVVTAGDAFGNIAEEISPTFNILLQDTAVDQGLPARSGLAAARPNPFNPATILSFSLATPGHTRLTVHDLRGRTVRTLIDHDLAAGDWTSRWDGRDDAGRTLPANTYLTRLWHAGRSVETRKVVMLP